jgi:hypothetical protein
MEGLVMTRYLFIGALGLGLLTVTSAIAQTERQFSGVWRLDPLTSAPPLSESLQASLTVTQTADDLEFKLEGPKGAVVSRYSLVGESTITGPGGVPVTARASWQGTRLVVAGTYRTPQGMDVPLQRIVRLSADGRQLIEDEVISSPNTQFKRTHVFIRVP